MQDGDQGGTQGRSGQAFGSAWWPTDVSPWAALTILAALAAYGIVIAAPSGALMDFGSFIASGRAASAGLDPYGVYPLTLKIVFPTFEIVNPNLNPPVSIPLFAFLGRFDPVAAFRAWWMVSFVCFALAVFALVHARRIGLVAAVWAFALAGFWDTLALGQIYAPLVLAGVLAWLFAERGHPIASGLLMAIVVAVKPNFLVWPVLLLLGGERRIAVVALGAAALLSVIPVVLYGPQIYQQWLAVVLADAGRARFVTNVSLVGWASRAGLPMLGTMAGVALLLALALWVHVKRPGLFAISTLAILGALLASPIAWVHYTLFLLPFFLRRRSASPAAIAAALLLTIPVTFIVPLLDAPAWLQLSLGSVYNLAVVLVLGAIAMELRGGISREPLRWAGVGRSVPGSS